MLATLAIVMTLVVAVLHVLFMVLETFLWTTPTGLKVFGQSKEDAEKTKVLAANQGVYNGALAGLLAWAALAPNPPAMVAGQIFVIVVGVYGAATAARSILFLQAMPAAIALGLTLAA